MYRHLLHLETVTLLMTHLQQQYIHSYNTAGQRQRKEKNSAQPIPVEVNMSE